MKLISVDSIGSVAQAKINYHIPPTQLVPLRLLIRDLEQHWLTNYITVPLPRLEDGLLGENVRQESQWKNSEIDRDCISADS